MTILKPQSRFFSEPPTNTNEAAIDTGWNGQLYAVLGEQDEPRPLAAAACGGSRS